jgi:hypothetical protein
MIAFLSQAQTDKMPFSMVDVPPSFLEFNDEEKSTLIKMFNQKLTEIVNTNFDKGIAMKLGLTKRQRIFSSFIISKDGSIKNIAIKAVHKKLEDEMRRVIEGLKLNAGKHNGKSVDIIYSYPFTFIPN